MQGSNKASSSNDPKTRPAPNQEVISRPRDPVPEGQDPLSEIVEVGEVAAGDGLALGRYRAELPEDPEPSRLAELECEHARAALL